MSSDEPEVTLRDALQDPLVQAVMKSDHIEERELLDLMGKVAGYRDLSRQKQEQ